MKKRQKLEWKFMRIDIFIVLSHFIPGHRKESSIKEDSVSIY
jgi:hypothetical protein